MPYKQGVTGSTPVTPTKANIRDTILNEILRRILSQAKNFQG